MDTEKKLSWLAVQKHIAGVEFHQLPVVFDQFDLEKNLTVHVVYGTRLTHLNSRKVKLKIVYSSP